VPGGNTRGKRGPGWRARQRAKEAEEAKEARDAQEAIDPSQLDDGSWTVDTGTGFWVTLPDGTVVEAPGDDFEDVETGELRPGRDTWGRALQIGGVLGAIGVLAALMLLFNGGEADTGTLDTTSSTVQETDATGGESVEESEEPLSAVDAADGEFVAALIDCPAGTQQDATGRRPSPRPGEEVKEVAEIAAVTDIDGAFDLQCSGFGFGSYLFTMIVDGDAETAFVADGTTFDLRFVVNSTWPQNVFEDDTGFTVFVDWNRPAGVYLGNVNDSTNTRIEDATVDIVWLDPSTLEATVTLPGDDIDVRKVRTELSGLTQDAQERTIAQYFDVAIWNATP